MLLFYIKCSFSTIYSIIMLVKVKKNDSACKKTYKSTPRSFISINYMHIFEQNHFRQTHLLSILKNGRHLGFFNGTSGRFVK